MKKHIPVRTLAVLCLLPFAAFAQKSTKIDLKVELTDAPNTQVVLGYYYGDKQFVIDTIKLDAKGTGVFKYDEPKERGIYLVAIPGKKFIEVLLTDDQEFSIKTDTAEPVQHMKVTGSVENEHFYEYNRFLNTMQKKADPLRKQKEAFSKDAAKKDSLAICTKQLDDLDKEVKKYRNDFVSRYPNDMMSKIITMMREPEIPAEIPAPWNANDSLQKVFRFRYYKAHFFDGWDWKEDGLVRTPVYHSKITQYMDQLTVQHPDSIMLGCDFLIEQARPSRELFKYTCHHLTFKYEMSKIMCFDAIFVHLADRYYKTNQAFWLSAEAVKKITDRADKLRYGLCGANPANMTLYDTTAKVFNLQNVKGKFIIIAFWDPSCGHCKKEIPLLKKEYDALKKYGVEVVAMATEDDTLAWKKFIKENNLNWKNGRTKDDYTRALYKHYYDIYSTPVLYLVDENKKIIAKRLDPAQMSDLIYRKLKLTPPKREPKKETDKHEH